MTRNQSASPGLMSDRSDLTGLRRQPLIDCHQNLASALRWFESIHPRDRHSYNFPPLCLQFVSFTPSLWNQFLAKGSMPYNGEQDHTSVLVARRTA
ncbi:hypothetical protein B0H12DRAFT_1119742 [Mycena haematopus]|nr:hypothetical protein B0H12DRAFT_1119742 [Mycena haematopus]